MVLQSNGYGVADPSAAAPGPPESNDHSIADQDRIVSIDPTHRVTRHRPYAQSHQTAQKAAGSRYSKIEGR
jgi:hypothetical protein